jgi:hypothetical protein
MTNSQQANAQTRARCAAQMDAIAARHRHRTGSEPQRWQVREPQRSATASDT